MAMSKASIEESVSSEFSISQWCDTDDVLARLDALLKQPIRPIRSENMPKARRLRNLPIPNIETPARTARMIY